MHNLRKGKAPQAVRDTSTASTDQSTDETPGLSSQSLLAQGPVSVPSRSPSPALTRDDITQIVAEQLALALRALKAGDSQTPPTQGNYERIDRDTAISSVETLAAQRTGSRDGPIRGTDAQELSDGADPTFEAWRLQVLARFRDDPGWYNSEERKLDYMLRRTKGNAQVHMLAGMQDEQFPGFFETAQDALRALRQALVNPQALREAQHQFRALRMSSTEPFAQFRTRFLLLAHESHVRPEDYRDELWYKITPALGTAVAAVQAQMTTYDQLADCLLSTDTTLRWLTPRPTPSVSTRRERNHTGQFVPTASARRAEPSPLAPERPHDRTSASSSFLTTSSKPPVPAVRHSTTPVLNPSPANDTCFNCGQLGHRSPDCPAPRIPRTQLKELQQTPESDSEDDQLADVTGKDTL